MYFYTLICKKNINLVNTQTRYKKYVRIQAQIAFIFKYAQKNNKSRTHGSRRKYSNRITPIQRW